MHLLGGYMHLHNTEHETVNLMTYESDEIFLHSRQIHNATHSTPLMLILVLIIYILWAMEHRKFENKLKIYKFESILGLAQIIMCLFSICWLIKRRRRRKDKKLVAQMMLAGMYVNLHTCLPLSISFQCEKKANKFIAKSLIHIFLVGVRLLLTESFFVLFCSVCAIFDAFKKFFYFFF